MDSPRTKIVPFNILPLGARFRYIHPTEKRVWSKIDQNGIALWDESQIDTNWVGQQICCFTDEIAYDQYNEKALAVDVEAILYE